MPTQPPSEASLPNNPANPPMAKESRWEILVRTVIFLWFVVITLNAIPSLNEKTLLIAFWANKIITIFFVVEYVVRIATAPSKRAYIFSPMGLIDFVVCLPFVAYLVGGNLDMLNMLRLTRILAIFQIARYRETMNNIHKAYLLVRYEVLLFLTVVGCLLYVLAFGIYYAEHAAQPEKFASVLDGLWFAVETVSTVGYGDLCPVTGLGRVLTGCIVMISVATVAISTGLITAALTSIWQGQKAPATPQALPSKEEVFSLQVNDPNPSEAIEEAYIEDENKLNSVPLVIDGPTNLEGASTAALSASPEGVARGTSSLIPSEPSSSSLSDTTPSDPSTGKE